MVQNAIKEQPQGAVEDVRKVTEVPLEQDAL